MKKLLLLASALTLSTSVCATSLFDFNPYAGADYRHASMKSKGRGKAIFPESFGSGNYYIGSRFHPNFAAELAYERSNRKTLNQLYGPTGVIFNIPGGALAPGFQHVTRLRVESLRLNGLAYAPLNDDWEVFARLGYATIKTTAVLSYVISPAGVVNSNLTVPKRKGMWSFGVGAEYKVNVNWFVRGTYDWQNTSVLEMDVMDNVGLRLNDLKPYQGSSTFGIGIQYRF